MPLFTLFHIASSRGRKVLEELVGTDYEGAVHFDYFSANCSFAWNFDIKAQYCLAHLIRDIRFPKKHPDKKTKAWAKHLLDRSRKIFSSWHRRNKMTEAGFRRSMVIQRDRFLGIVRKSPDSTKVDPAPHFSTANRCNFQLRFTMEQDAKDETLFKGTMPKSAFHRDRDFVYYIEVIDMLGNGCYYPDWETDQPFTFVEVEP